MSKQEEREAIEIVGSNHDIAPVISHVKRIVNNMSSEMRDDRNDGWVKLHYRNSLKDLRDYINTHLEEHR